MNEQILMLLFLIAVIAASIDIMRRAVLMVKTERAELVLHRAMRRLRRPSQPQVTILLFEQGPIDDLKKSLRTIRQLQYHAYDVVIVSEHREKRQEMLSLLRGSEVLLMRQRPGSRMHAYQAAYKKSRRGEIVVYLTSGVTLPKNGLKRIVASGHSRLSWTTKLSVKKTVPEGLQGIVYSMRQIIAPRFETIPASTPKVLRTLRFSPRYRFDRSLLVVIMWAALIAFGFVWFGLTALWYGWLVTLFYVVSLVWLQGSLSFRAKLLHTLAAPTMLFTVPTTSLIEGIFQLSARK